MTAEIFTWATGAALLVTGAIVVLSIAVALGTSAIVRRLDAILDELRRRDA